MAIDVQALIAEAQAKRAEAQAQADAARQAADAQKATNKAAKDIITKANVSLGYAKNLEPSIKNLEGTIRIYTTRLSRGDKLSPMEQKEFDKAVADYGKVNAAYNKAITEGNKILANIPKGAEPGIKPVIKNGGENTFQLSPGAGGTVSGDGEGKVARDFATEISTAPAVVLRMSEPERSRLASALNAAGYKVPKTGVYSDQLVAAYQQALGANQIRNTNLAAAKLPELGFDDFLKVRSGEPDVTGVGGVGGAGVGGTTKRTSISAPTEAAAAIQQVFSSVLGRDATAKEVKALTAKLNAEEKNNPVKTVTDAKGNTTYTGGIDAGQFLTTIVKALPEYGTKKAAAGKTIESQILETAMDNNLSATPEQIKTWVSRVQNGEDARTIQTEIRNTASLGYSDQIKKLMAAGTDLATVLSPYKTAMATTLGINPATISLNDPTLNMAIANPEGKEISLFEYQTRLRKDPRWQFTDQARSEAADVAQKVLKDFGFMG